MGACHVHWPRKVVALMRVGSVVTWTILFVLSLCTLKPPFVLTDTSVLPTVCFLLSSLDDLRCSDTVGGEIGQNGTSTADNSLLAKTLPQFASRAPVFVFIRATNCSLATSTLQDSYLDKVRTFFPPPFAAIAQSLEHTSPLLCTAGGCCTAPDAGRVRAEHECAARVGRAVLPSAQRDVPRRPLCQQQPHRRNPARHGSNTHPCTRARACPSPQQLSHKRCSRPAHTGRHVPRGRHRRRSHCSRD